MNYNHTKEDNMHYTRKQIKDLISGDIILHPIYRTDGLMLVNENKALTPALISMIKKHVMTNKYVLVAPSREILDDFIMSNSFDTEQFIKDSKEIAVELDFKTNAQALYHDSNSKQDLFSSLLLQYPMWASMESKLESEPLKARAQEVKNELLKSMHSNKTLIELFSRIKDYDDVLLIHSINTMCISILIGLTIELTKEQLLDLAFTALFSNIGFVEIDKKDFLNFLKTNEHINEQLKRHLEVFSEITKDFPELRKKEIVYGILDHHEYYNGKGYPNGKAAEEISLYGRILFIAHNYDELVGGYNYQIGLHSLEALGLIYENHDKRYDQNIMNIFVNRTNYFKLGETISLPNMGKGIIIGFDDFVKTPHLPIIKLESGVTVNLADRYKN